MSDSIIEPRGSGIDPEIAGPIPPNPDGRQRDILQDQEDRQRGRQAVGESIVDAPQPPPPEAFDVSPPPPMPNMVFSSQDPYDVAKEAAQDVFRDFLKNFTINGVAPDVSGGEVSFKIPTEPSASSSFASMNGLDILTKPQDITIQPPVTTSENQSQAAQQEQISNLQGQISETQANSLNALSPETAISPEINVLDSVKVSVDESYNKRNSSQRTWSDYEGDNPISRHVGTTYYANSEKHGPQQTQLEESPLLVPDNGMPPPPNNQPQGGGEQDAPQIVGKGFNIADFFKNIPDIKDFEANTEKAKDYASTNDPFAQYVFFDVCSNGEPRRFLIPAFGPYLI
jgi:TolA-binding protein